MRSRPLSSNSSILRIRRASRSSTWPFWPSRTSRVSSCTRRARASCPDPSRRRPTRSTSRWAPGGSPVAARTSTRGQHGRRLRARPRDGEPEGSRCAGQRQRPLPARVGRRPLHVLAHAPRDAPHAHDRRAAAGRRRPGRPGPQLGIRPGAPELGLVPGGARRRRGGHGLDHPRVPVEHRARKIRDRGRRRRRRRLPARRSRPRRLHDDAVGLDEPRLRPRVGYVELFGR